MVREFVGVGKPGRLGRADTVEPPRCNSTAMAAPPATRCQLRSDEAWKRSDNREYDMASDGNFGVGG